ncbi:TauD/TfdA family dioxygenase [Micromonospora sp. KC213]|uniref:TauD/TfdA family dioxygenase n=1 Tax=Micromonospora sp. KC213 TaxID=2530378 RepID=UPI001FB80317|nr:TauD/TfdA family dioxygenase [Micromonospora sp. KC213]
MPTLTPLERLRTGTAARPITFDSIPPAPVPANPDRISPDTVAEIVRRYRRHGFAVAQFAPGPWTEQTVERLAVALDLGEPFVPPLYSRGGYSSPPVSRIGAPAVDDTSGTLHPHFETTVGQELHCDGTLQDIGEVKSVILLCQSQGLDGGTTTLFNAHGAFTKLLDVDPEAARALTAHGVLVRQATFNGSSEIKETPVFAVDGEQLICRYCVDATDRWAVPKGSDAAAIARGAEFLHQARQVGSTFIRRFDLAAGQALVMDNTRISHGRDAYRDGPGRRRCLLRSLHLRHPRVDRSGDDGR